MEHKESFWTAEVAQVLGIKAITVRTWALLFERLGYAFVRDHNGRRVFTERDISMLRHFKELTHAGKVKQDDAVAATLQHFDSTNQPQASSSPMMKAPHQSNEDHQVILERMEQLNSLLMTTQSQLSQLMTSHAEVATRLEAQNSRVDTLVELIQQMHSAHLQLASTIERDSSLLDLHINVAEQIREAQAIASEFTNKRDYESKQRHAKYLQQFHMLQEFIADIATEQQELLRTRDEEILNGFHELREQVKGYEKTQSNKGFVPFWRK